MTDPQGPAPTTEAHLDPLDVRMFPALTILERQCMPLHRGREPYWRAPITPASQDCYIPHWNWRGPHELPHDADVTTLDANGAYLGAAGGVKIAHSHLTHTGPWDSSPEPRLVPPGYYRITVPPWAFSGMIVSPLGDSARLKKPALWVAAPTLVLLLELHENGYLGQVDILDSWTAATTADFRAWVARLKTVRTELLDRIDTRQTDAARAGALSLYNAFKEGYSAALSMILTGTKCRTRRPDWSHTVYAQHAASQWRKAWRFAFTGAPLVSMGHVDEIAVLTKDLPAALQLAKPPFRYDPTGRAVGAMKPKHTGPLTTPQPPAESAAVNLEDTI